ncbi:nucleoside transporter family [Hortaea werneckii]|nr:nucleoside transporter family [Hortaea werneckii]
MASARDSASGMLDRLRKAWKGEQEYEPLANGNTEGGVPDQTSGKQRAFSWIEYSIFLLLGVSMLWAWNMFLAAGPYFQQRFQSNKWIFDNFQAAEISVSTVTNLGSMLLPDHQYDYIRSTCTFHGSIPGYHRAWVLRFPHDHDLLDKLGYRPVSERHLCVCFRVRRASIYPRDHDGSSYCWSTPMHCSDRDGSPPPRGPPPVHPGSAFAYFLTATAISVVTLLAFFYLYARNRQPERLQDNTTPDNSDEPEERKEIPLRVLFRKLFWLASASSPNSSYPSGRKSSNRRSYSQQASSLLPSSVPSLTLAHRPKIVLVLAFSRIGFLGLYHLCNIRGRGAVVESDFFYLVVVQLLFGLTNGYLGSTCMIGAGQWVEPEEREAAGGFMGLCLVGGLTAGSLASFFAAGA